MAYLDAAYGKLGRGGLLVFGDEARRLHENAAGATGGVEDAPVEGLDDLRQQPDDAPRRVELGALVPLCAGEIAEEVFVDEAEYGAGVFLGF